MPFKNTVATILGGTGEARRACPWYGIIKHFLLSLISGMKIFHQHLTLPLHPQRIECLSGIGYECMEILKLLTGILGAGSTGAKLFVHATEPDIAGLAVAEEPAFL